MTTTNYLIIEHDLRKQDVGMVHALNYVSSITPPAERAKIVCLILDAAYHDDRARALRVMDAMADMERRADSDISAENSKEQP